ncbi:MAG: hypothetical protein Greene101449_1264 [Candidatus Peregrinibacteria bacterium Greene1014_49]|nr:MAG: hypothetical protein Greene101449_1264 [Candidatus Peregrinibacteria bacterium Greene1014_49]
MDFSKEPIEILKIWIRRAHGEEYTTVAVHKYGRKGGNVPALPALSTISALFLQFILLQRLLILLRLIHAQIIEERPALGDFAKKSTAGGVVFLMVLKVLREFADLLTENRDLHRRRSCVFGMCAVLGNETLFIGTLESHGC